MEPVPRSERIRNLTGFWLLGLCNNFGYVVMLSAAHDIMVQISPASHNGTDANSTANRSDKLVPECNPVSTGAVLLADILPTLIIKLTAPFYILSLPYWVKVGLTVFFGLCSYPIVAASRVVWVSLLGVVCASISSGFGEVTFLSLSSYFEKNVISTWSSGTGAAGVFGALGYAGLIAVGLSARNTLFLMLIIPFVLAISYYILLVKPVTFEVRPNISEVDDTTPLVGSNKITGTLVLKDLKSKLSLIVPLLPYMIPLMLVYFAEYFINQGLQELVYFENSWLTLSEQYRWYQVIYQVGVLISRSSVNCLKIRKTWILSILQFLNVALLLFQIFFKFIPNIWIVFAIILYEGLLGGAAYVNTFYMITEEVKEEDREFSMGVGSVSDSLGISIAGAVAIPVHNFICTL